MEGWVPEIVLINRSDNIFTRNNTIINRSVRMIYIYI